MNHTVLYTRQGCHLCDEARDLLSAHGLEPQLIDIDADNRLSVKFNTCVPVVEINGKIRFRGRVDPLLLRRLLAHRTVPVNDRCLAVFAKHWTPGFAKTRLANDLSDDAAAAIYKEFLAATLGRLRTVAAQRILVFAPPWERADFARLAPDWQLVPQTEGDLGARLADFFSAQFAAGSRRIVVVGADSPDLPVEYVERAFETLAEHDVAIGPTDDGGYYLLGARDAAPPVFAGIAWGTGDVYGETRARLAAAQRSFDELPSWYDVDLRADLDRLTLEIAQLDQPDPHLARLAASLQTTIRADGK